MKAPLLSLGAMALALAACTPVNLPGGSPGAIPAPSQPVQTAPKLITPARAIGLFDNVCGKALPQFDNIAQMASANGVTSQSGGIAVSPTEAVSFQVKSGPGTGESCVMTFETVASTQDVSDQITGSFGDVIDTPFGPAAKYRARNSLVLIDPNVTDRGSSRIFRLSLLSER